MLDLKWREVADGFESGPYRVEPLREHPRHNWQLLIPAASDVLGGARWPTMPTTHRTRRGAYALACHIESERIRRIRAIRHGVVGAVLMLLFSALLANGDSVPTFIISLVLLAAALRSLGTAVVLTIGDAWGWTDVRQPVERETRLEAMMTQAVAKLRPRPNRGEHREPRVRVLPPLPPD